MFLFLWLAFIDHFENFPPLGPRWMVTHEWGYDSFVCCSKASGWLKGDCTWLGWVRIFFSKCAKWSRMVTFCHPQDRTTIEGLTAHCAAIRGKSALLAQSLCCLCVIQKFCLLTLGKIRILAPPMHLFPISLYLYLLPDMFYNVFCLYDFPVLTIGFPRRDEYFHKKNKTQIISLIN